MATKSFCLGEKGGRDHRHQGMGTTLALGPCCAKRAAGWGGGWGLTRTSNVSASVTFPPSPHSCHLASSRGRHYSFQASPNILKPMFAQCMVGKAPRATPVLNRSLWEVGFALGNSYHALAMTVPSAFRHACLYS